MIPLSRAKGGIASTAAEAALRDTIYLECPAALPAGEGMRGFLRQLVPVRCPPLHSAGI